MPEPRKLNNVGLVVFDEFHLVNGNFDDKRANDAMTLVVELLDIIPKADYFSFLQWYGMELMWLVGLSR